MEMLNSIMNYRIQSPLQFLWTIFSLLTGAISIAVIFDRVVDWKGFMEQLIIIYASMFYWIPDFLFITLNIKVPNWFDEYYAVGFIYSLAIFEIIHKRALITEAKKILRSEKELFELMRYENPNKPDPEVDYLAYEYFRKNRVSLYPFTYGKIGIRMIALPFISVLWPGFIFLLLSQDDEKKYFALFNFYMSLLSYICLLLMVVCFFDVVDLKGTMR